MPKRLTEVFAGRWQIPLALVAVVVGGVTLYRLAPTQSRPPLSTVLADLAALEQSGDVVAAADAVENLLELKPPLLPAEQAALHGRMADLLFRVERQAANHSENNARKLLTHVAAARELGAADDGAARFREACARQWLGEKDAALTAFQAAINAGVRGEDRRAALAATVELLDDQPDAGRKRAELLDGFLADEELSPAQTWWGLQRAIDAALDGADAGAARELLTERGARLKGAELKGYLEYLNARVSLATGQPEAAEPIVRWIDEWLAEKGRSVAALDAHGHLPTLNGWLGGQVELAMHRPAEALASFDRTLEYRPATPMRAATLLGRGRALAALDRNDEAVTVWRAVLDEAARAPSRCQRVVRELHTALLDLFARKWEQSQAEPALAYLSLALDTIPPDDTSARAALCGRLGEAYAEAARAATSPEQQRRFHEQAGVNLETAANGIKLNEPRRADLLWNAAGEFDLGGLIANVRRLLTEFVRGRSEHPQMPAALLQLGRACDALGQVEEALRWYGQVISDYTGLEQAARARVLRANLRLSLGPANYAAAEADLVHVLDGELAGPEAEIFHDALLALSELLYYGSRHAEAISRLEEFARLYPQDAEHLRAAFMLADAHRRSAYALCAAGADSAATNEGRQRFRRAAELFAALVPMVDAAPQSALNEVYARLGLFYRADCLFELNEPETLEAALAAYRSAVARYDGRPAVLAAQIQIANTLLRLGDRAGAGRAVEAARWALRMLPADTGFDADGRAEWERFLSLVSQSDLMKQELALAP